MKLYFNRFTRATRPRWLLEELGVPCEIVNVDLRAGEHKTDAYKAVHPLGRLPAFVEDDGQVIFESAAIVLHLADRFPEAGLAPAPGSSARGLYYQWVVYAVSELEGPVLRIFREWSKAEALRDAAAVEAAQLEFNERAEVLSQALQGRDWLLGDFSAADVMIGSILAWGERMGAIRDFPTLQAYSARCQARPAYKASRV